VSIKIVDREQDGEEPKVLLTHDQIAELSQQISLQIDGWMTSDQVCEWLQLRREYLYDLVATDRIPYVKLGRLLRFKRAELEAWIEEHRA
jgi:excisionase family DNA binding protein